MKGTTYKGECKPLREWARIYGIEYGTLCSRVYTYDWSLEEAFNIPTGVLRTNRPMTVSQAKRDPRGASQVPYIKCTQFVYPK